MKLLLVHNDYAKYSGEEAVVDKMHRMLADLGHEVRELRMSTAGERDSLKGKVKGFVAGLYSPGGVKAMREALRDFKPDVVNVHNLYPFISPAALQECRKAGVPVVMTVHNYRLMCPTGLFMRDNRPCELCLKRGNEWGCVKYNCEHSLLKSVGYAARNYMARLRRDYLDCVDRFACLTEFQARKLAEAGFDPNKLTVIPNSIDVGPLVPGRSEYVAYAGRLSREKGIELILEAARRNPDIPFRLAGAMGDDEELNSKLRSLPNVTLTGHLSGSDLEDFYRNASFFVMASTWYEGFPMTILETGRYGKPMIGPNHGGFPEILRDTGVLFEPGNADELSVAVKELWNDPQRVKTLGERTYSKIKSEFSTSIIADKWQSILYQ